MAASLAAGLAAALLLLAACLVLLALAVIMSPTQMYRLWKLRHLPGASLWFVPPVLGDLLEIVRVGGAQVIAARTRDLGPIFKLCIGRTVWVTTTDPEFIRLLGFRSTTRDFTRTLMRGDLRYVIHNDIVASDDELWRSLRSAWQPAFSSASLRGYLPLMVKSADELVALLLRRGSAGGEKGAGEGPLELHALLGCMTLQVVGSCAFGVDFRCFELEGAAAQQQADAAAEEEGMALTHACRDIFETLTLKSAGRWVSASALLPEFRPVWRVLAHLFPDDGFTKQLKARKKLLSTARALLNDWQRHSKPAVAADVADGTDGAALEGRVSAPGPQVSASPPDANVRSALSDVDEQQLQPQKQQQREQGQQAGHDEDGRGGRPRGVASVAPGSFLDLLLAARKRQAHVQPLNDLQIIAQAQVFILAGYETTANALAFAVHAISSHPEVEQKLLAEVDAVLAAAGPDAPLDEEMLAKMTYMEAVMNESMRLMPSVAGTIRTLKEETAVGGYTLPAGSKCLLSFYVVQRSKELWGPDALEFRPERFLGEGGGPPVPFSYVPFGLGARMCIGYKFAQMEMKVALTQLYRHLTFKLAPGQVPIQIEFGFTNSPKGGVWVTPVQRARPV